MNLTLFVVSIDYSHCISGLFALGFSPADFLHVLSTAKKEKPTNVASLPGADRGCNLKSVITYSLFFS